MSSNNETLLIEITDLVRRFSSPNGDTFIVLDGINMSIKSGEIVALLGRSGSGKSTLLRIIAGLISPTSGSVKALGSELRGANDHTAMVFQSFALMPWLTVEANVELGLEARKVPKQERQELTSKAITTIGLDGFEDSYPRELSGGMRQRVGFARALVLQPDLLLMDEPFSALDVLTAENLRNEVIDLWNQADFHTKSVCIVTHNIEEAVLMADRVIILGSKPGRIVYEKTITAPRPRDRNSSEFTTIVDELYEALTGYPTAHNEGQFISHKPGELTPFTRPLPNASVDGLGGLIDIISAVGGTVDLPDLASDLNFEIDDLIPLVDAAQLLHLISVKDNEIYITDIGQEFQEASISDARSIFAGQLLDYAPLVRTIVRALKKTNNGKLTTGFFIDLLQSGFSHADAEEQLGIAIDWGRYSDLFDFDKDSNILVLDKEAKEDA